MLLSKKTGFIALFMTCLSSIWAQTQFTSNALNFDGVDDYVDVQQFVKFPAITNPLYPGFGAPFTMEAWVKTTNATDTMVIIDFGRDSIYSHVSMLIAGGKINFYNKGVGKSSHFEGTTNVADGQWHHLAITANVYGGNYKKMRVTVKLFVDFKYENGEDYYSKYEAVRLGQCRIGRPIDNTVDEYFEGTLSEVRIYRAPQNIANYTSRQKYCPADTANSNFSLYYRFDQGIAGGDNNGNETAFDSTGNQNDATLMNFALTGTSSNWVGDGPIIERPDVNMVMPGSAICTNDTLLFTGSGADTYEWFDRNWNSVATGKQWKPVLSGDTTVYLVGTDPTNACITSDTVIRTITPEITPQITATISDGMECKDSTITIRASGANTYLWSGGNREVDTTLQLTDTLDFTITGRLAGGNCTGINRSQFYPKQGPEISIVADPPSICCDSNITLSVEPSSAQSNWQWNTGTTNASWSAKFYLDTLISVEGNSAGQCVSRATYLVSTAPAVDQEYWGAGNAASTGYSKFPCEQSFEAGNDGVLSYVDLKLSKGSNAPNNLYVYMRIKKDGSNTTKAVIGNASVLISGTATQAKNYRFSFLNQQPPIELKKGSIYYIEVYIQGNSSNQLNWEIVTSANGPLYPDGEFYGASSDRNPPSSANTSAYFKTYNFTCTDHFPELTLNSSLNGTCNSGTAPMLTATQNLVQPFKADKTLLLQNVQVWLAEVIRGANCGGQVTLTITNSNGTNVLASDNYSFVHDDHQVMTEVGFDFLDNGSEVVLLKGMTYNFVLSYIPDQGCPAMSVCTNTSNTQYPNLKEVNKTNGNETTLANTAIRNVIYGITLDSQEALHLAYPACAYTMNSLEERFWFTPSGSSLSASDRYEIIVTDLKLNKEQGGGAGVYTGIRADGVPGASFKVVFDAKNITDNALKYDRVFSVRVRDSRGNSGPSFLLRTPVEP